MKAGILVLFLTLAGCGRCDGGDPAGAGTAQLPRLGGDATSAGLEVPMPGAVYKEAYRRARGQVTAENARERLDELERTIDQEALELP
jgi:hypothetical protein